MRFAHALAVLAVAACLSAGAAVPTTMSYQGYLTSPTGVPVNATVTMTLKLYDAPLNGTMVWSESQPVVVANGVYNVVLGNTIPLTEALLNGPRYLTVAVGTDGDMAPRTPLASAPYAILAKALDGTVPVGSGGTGLTNVPTGGLVYGQGASALGVTSAGSVGQVLTATAGGVPQWSNSAPSLQIAHPGPGSLSIQSAGTGVSIQGTVFDNAGISLGSARTLLIGGNQVVGERQSGLPNAMESLGVDGGAATGVQVVTSAEYNALVVRFNATLDRLRAHGLLDASGSLNLLTGAFVTPSSLGSSATVFVTIGFHTENAWPADGRVQIVFPAGFNVSGSTLLSEGVSGTLTLSVAGQTVTLTRSGGVAEAGGTTVAITLGSIQNPSGPVVTNTFSITTQTSSGTPIDSGTAPAVTIP